MVRSKIFNECIYLETKQINERDENIDIQLYKIKLLNCENVYITVGSSNKKHRKTCLKQVVTTKNDDDYTNDDNIIVYHPIYLMDSQDNEIVISRIGVYEIMKSKYNDFLDSDGDLLVDNLEPLLFSFITDEFLIKHKYSCSIEIQTIDDIKEQLVENEQNIGKFLEKEAKEAKETKDDGRETPPILLEKEADADKLLEIYPKQNIDQYNEEYTKVYLSKPLEGDENAIQWPRAYLLNKNFKIIDKGGGGDCLFCVLASAINDFSVNNKGNGIPVFSMQDVNTLRTIVSENVTENDYDNYVTIYKDLYEQKRVLTLEIKRFIEEHKHISDNFKQTTNEARRKELVLENKEIKRKVNELESQLKNVKEMLNEFKYMKSLKSLRDFKSYITSSNYWGDEMALGILQKHFNFKAIILSQQDFIKNTRAVSLPLTEGFVKNMKNIIQCGSTSLGGMDSPNFYIILNYTGDHYQIISYRNKEAFTFDEIPFSLKIAISKECMKQDLSAGYGKIKQFVDFRDTNIELMF